MRTRFLLILLVFALSALFKRAEAVELFFLPDTSFGQIGDTVTLSALMTASDTVRSFAVYMVYDTNLVDLASAPVPGALVAGRAGLDFRYADHVPAAPDWLEVGATVFSTDYWAGPGELFQVRFVFRGCGDVSMTADVGFRRPNGTFIPGTFNPPEFRICGHVPQNTSMLTIREFSVNSIILRWYSVTLDTLGQPLPPPVLYIVYRQQIEPTQGAVTLISTVPDTTYVDNFDTGTQYTYYVVVQQGQ
jgi:hypothetical protein